jgi:hypothetical protein
MRRRLQAFSVLAFLIHLTGCSEPVPTVPSVAPPPTNTAPAGAPGVIQKPLVPSRGHPDPNTPKAL